MHKFFLALSLLSISVSSSAIAQISAAVRPEEQAACSRDVQRFCRPVIDQGDFTDPGLPAAEPPEDLQGVRSGPEEPQPISRIAVVSVRIGLGRRTDCVGTANIADSIGFSGVFPYMGFAIGPLVRTIGARPHPTNVATFLMTTASELRSGKTHRDENFPVASWIIHRRHRALILAFYNFVRTADDIADHATLDASEKLALPRSAGGRIAGEGRHPARGGQALRRALAERAMPPRHALDVLIAFRMDVTKLRYENWDEVIHYCRYSAMPVGRFMLDVHGEKHVDLGRFRCAVRGVADQQSSAGLRQGFSRPQPGLFAARCAGRGGRVRRATRAAIVRRRRCCNACSRSRCARKRCSTRANRSARSEGFAARAGNLGDPEFCRPDRRMLKVRDPLSERVHLGPTAVARP